MSNPRGVLKSRLRENKGIEPASNIILRKGRSKSRRVQYRSNTATTSGHINKTIEEQQYEAYHGGNLSGMGVVNPQMQLPESIMENQMMVRAASTKMGVNTKRGQPMVKPFTINTVSASRKRERPTTTLSNGMSLINSQNRNVTNRAIISQNNKGSILEDYHSIYTNNL